MDPIRFSVRAWRKAENSKRSELPARPIEVANRGWTFCSFQVPEPAGIGLSIATQPNRARRGVACQVFPRKILKADGADFHRFSMAIDETAVGSSVMPGDRAMR